MVAANGDTYYKIAEEFGLTLRQLYRYNDFESTKDCLQEGDVIYIQPKRRRNLFKSEEQVINKDMSLIEISQKFAVNEKTLKRMNDLTDDKIVAKGEKVTLR